MSQALTLTLTGSTAGVGGSGVSPYTKTISMIQLFMSGTSTEPLTSKPRTVRRQTNVDVSLGLAMALDMEDVWIVLGLGFRVCIEFRA